MAQGLGVEVRASRQATWTQCRQRGGAVIRGSLVALDLAGTDALTADYSAGSKGNLGTQSTASSPFGTVLEATAGMTVGRLGVAMGGAIKDDGLGDYELGEVGGGLVAPVIVPDTLVLVDAASVAGAALQVSASGGTAVFAAGVAGTTYAILLEDCTTDDAKGPSADYNYRSVLFYTQGLASENATLSADSVGNAELRNSAALSVIGRSANTVGDPADIVGADGQALRVSGTTLGFGTIVAAGIASDAVTTAKILDLNVTTGKLAANAVTADKTAPLTLNAQTGVSYTPALTDARDLVTLSNAAAITVTLPQDSDVAFAIGHEIAFMWLGVAQPTFAAGAGATVNASGGLLAIAAQYDIVTAIKRAANTWVLAGARA